MSLSYLNFCIYVWVTMTFAKEKHKADIDAE